jgi:hypothetical protein
MKISNIVENSINTTCHQSPHVHLKLIKDFGHFNSHKIKVIQHYRHSF